MKSPFATTRRLLLALGVAFALPLSGPALAQPDFQVVDVNQLASQIRASVGQPAVVLLYGSECSLSKKMFPGFVQIARDHADRGVKFLVYNTDGEEYGEYAADFLKRHHATFAAVVVRDWSPGDLSRAMKPIGIHVGKTWTRPLVAVLDRAGRVTMQSQGETDLRPLRAALAKVAQP